jgi:hypothetical protein
MKNKNLTLIFFLYLIISSCRTVYKINSSAKNYIPYKGNELLTFKSDKGKIDTIFLTGVGNYYGCYDPLAIFPDKCEGIVLGCKRTDPNYDRYLEGKYLIKIGVTKNKENYISFDIAMKGAWFYDNNQYSLIQFDSIPNNTLTIEDKIYSDVKIFSADNYANQFRDRINFVERFYWSASKGFLGLDKGNEKWRLYRIIEK